MTDLQVNDLLGMMTEQRTELKVRLLLERFKVVLKSQVYMYRCVYIPTHPLEILLCIYVVLKPTG